MEMFLKIYLFIYLFIYLECHTDKEGLFPKNFKAKVPFLWAKIKQNPLQCWF